MDRSNQIDTHIGRQIRRRRLGLGLSQVALANAVGVRFQQIQKYETGVQKLSAVRLWAVAVALGVAPSYFFEGLTERNAKDR